MIRSEHDRYLEWLERQVVPQHGWREGKHYTSLLHHLHQREFEWMIANDDNRIQDGFDLRHEAFDEMHLFPSAPLSTLGPVSMLEVLVALGRKMAFQVSGHPGSCTWRLINNMGLGKMSGIIGPIRASRIEEACDRVIYRTYQSDGVGGLFPLEYPRQDQRKVELWYQMQYYVQEVGIKQRRGR